MTLMVNTNSPSKGITEEHSHQFDQLLFLIQTLLFVLFITHYPFLKPRDCLSGVILKLRDRGTNLSCFYSIHRQFLSIFCNSSISRQCLFWSCLSSRISLFKTQFSFSFFFISQSIFCYYIFTVSFQFLSPIFQFFDASIQFSFFFTFYQRTKFLAFIYTIQFSQALSFLLLISALFLYTQHYRIVNSFYYFQINSVSLMILSYLNSFQTSFSIEDVLYVISFNSFYRNRATQFTFKQFSLCLCFFVNPQTNLQILSRIGRLDFRSFFCKGYSVIGSTPYLSIHYSIALLQKLVAL